MNQNQKPKYVLGILAGRDLVSLAWSWEEIREAEGQAFWDNCQFFKEHMLCHPPAGRQLKMGLAPRGVDKL